MLLALLVAARSAHAEAPAAEGADTDARRLAIYEAQRMYLTYDGHVVDASGERVPVEALFERLGDGHRREEFRAVRRLDKATWTPIAVTGGGLMVAGGLTMLAGGFAMFLDPDDQGRTLTAGSVLTGLGIAGVWTGITGNLVAASRRDRATRWYDDATLERRIAGYDASLRETLEISDAEAARAAPPGWRPVAEPSEAAAPPP